MINTVFNGFSKEIKKNSCGKNLTVDIADSKKIIIADYRHFITTDKRAAANSTFAIMAQDLEIETMELLTNFDA